MEEIKTILEIAVLMAHILIAIYEWDKIVSSVKLIISKTNKTTSKGLNSVRKNFIFFDMILIPLSCICLFFAGSSGQYIWGAVYFVLIWIVSFVFIPEDMRNYLNSQHE